MKRIIIGFLAIAFCLASANLLSQSGGQGNKGAGKGMTKKVVCDCDDCSCGDDGSKCECQGCDCSGKSGRDKKGQGSCSGKDGSCKSGKNGGSCKGN